MQRERERNKDYVKEIRGLFGNFSWNIDVTSCFVVVAYVKGFQNFLSYIHLHM